MVTVVQIVDEEREYEERDGAIAVMSKGYGGCFSARFDRLSVRCLAGTGFSFSRRARMTGEELTEMLPYQAAPVHVILAPSNSFDRGSQRSPLCEHRRGSK